MYKGYKIRLFPTSEQEELFWKHIYACKFIWNYMLNKQNENYKNGDKYLSSYDMVKLLKPLKNDGIHEWLYEVSNASLQRICIDIDKSFKLFFKHKQGYPKFKSKKCFKKIYPVRTSDGALYFDSKTVFISKIGKVIYKTDYNIPYGKNITFYNAHISYENNKWILTFQLKFEIQNQQLNDFNMGIDLGIKELAVVAVGDQKIVYHNINKSKRIKMLEQKSKHIQRCINRKYRTNGNYKKTNAIIKYEKIQKKICYKIENIRRNYIHQITHELVSLKPQRVIMEDLNISGMMKNKYLSKAIQDQCLYEFIRQMKYKCEWAGIEFVQADRFYPSSKTCSQCGEIKKDLKLSDRVYKCHCCGLEIDRDYNAAINLMNYSCSTE